MILQLRVEKPPPLRFQDRMATKIPGTLRFIDPFRSVVEIHSLKLTAPTLLTMDELESTSLDLKMVRLPEVIWPVEDLQRSGDFGLVTKPFFWPPI